MPRYGATSTSRAGAHVATEKLDDRYQLFFKGPTSAELAAAAKPPRNARPSLRRSCRRRSSSASTTHPNAQRLRAADRALREGERVDAALVKAIVAAESGYEPTAVSPKGALGLMQVIPETAARYGVTEDSEANDRAEALRSRDNMQRRHALPARLARALRERRRTRARRIQRGRRGRPALRQPQSRRIPETQEYVKLVTQLHALYKPPPATYAACRDHVPHAAEAPREER